MIFLKRSFNLLQRSNLFLKLFSRRSSNCAESSTSTNGEQEPITPFDDAYRFMVDCLQAVGVSQEKADTVALNLLEADFRGHYCQGINQLECYIEEIQHGLYKPNANPRIVKESFVTALVTGNNGLGAVNANFAMDLAIKKACKSKSVGIVSVKESNNMGRAGFYVMQAVCKGLIGIAFSNSPPYVIPTRAKWPALGTNMISVGVPELKGNNFLFDMTPTATTIGKIRIKQKKEQSLPIGWVLDSQGDYETNPTRALEAHRILPLGGTESHASYKGTALNIVIDILCGVLAGGPFGKRIPKYSAKTSGNKPANLSHCFIAIDPTAFGENFENRVTSLLSCIRKTPPIDNQLPVILPGDREREHMQKVKNDGGFRYSKLQRIAYKKLAADLHVEPMRSFYVRSLNCL